MFIDWTCVYDDGTRPTSQELDGDQRRPLSIATNEDVTIRIELVNPAREPVDLGTIDTNYVELTMRLADGRRVVKRSTKDGAGRYRIAIAAADTRSLDRQHATFDLFAVKGAGRVSLIQTSELALGR